MKSGTLFSMLANYLPTFVVGIGIFIVFFAQYSNGLTCFSPCETLVPDVASPPTADDCLKPTAGTECVAANNETSYPTKGTWFLPDHPFKPNTCYNVENGDKVTELKKTIAKAKDLPSLQMAHVCFCDAPDSCDKRDPDWDDVKLVDYFKTWTPPPPTAETMPTGDGGGGGGGDGTEPQLESNTHKVEAIPKIILFLIAAVSSSVSLSDLLSA